MNHLLPQPGEATLRLMLAGGFRVHVPPVHCCRLPPYSLGDLRISRALARRNLRLLSRLEVEAIAMDCAGCFSFLRGYPELLASKPKLAVEAASLSERVVELRAFLSSVEVLHPSQLLARGLLRVAGHAEPRERTDSLLWDHPGYRAIV